MRSLTSFQTNQNHPYFTNAPTNKGVSPLVSQYMDMFDASKVDMSLLQKRERPSVDDILQHELQKKVKTLMGNPVNAMPNLAAMLYGQQNLPLIQNILPVKPEVKTNFAEQLKMNSIRNLQQALNFKQQHDALHLLQSQIQKTPLTFKNPQTILTANTQDVYVKEEYTREESPSSKKSHTVISLPKPKMCDTMSENNTTNDSLSVASPDKGDFIMPSPIRDEPVLTEYTKAFPEWDLATIFSFLKSGKSMDAFEKEKKFRMERKLKKQRNSMKKEAKQSKKAIVM